MATLKCNSCGGNISSSARRVQCPHCGELFPFRCARCDHKLRPPFSVFDDERYLTLDTPPQTLCDEHYLRQCPDCQEWFSADENPGYFRCRSCAEIHERKVEAEYDEPVATAPATFAAPATATGGVATRTRPGQVKTGGNALVIGIAVCAFLVLVGWMILSR